MGFHAQQSCEKFIKAVLVSRGVVFGRTHDLITLFALCVAHEIQIPIDKNTLRILNQFAVRFRYESCFVEIIDLLDTAIIVEKLKLWAEQEI
ncbi:hypothetical protein CKO09_07875 [Chromatium weissei]|nr:hypothetical protein [Chromatium weissei]